MFEVNSLNFLPGTRPQLEVEGKSSICSKVDDRGLSEDQLNHSKVLSQEIDLLRRARIDPQEPKQYFKTRKVDVLTLSP